MRKPFNSLVSFIITVSLLFNLVFTYASHDFKVYADSDSNSLEIGQNYSGFKLLDKKYIEELQATTYEFINEQTKAKLLYLENNDENKIFAIAFKTLPQDNSGVFHIIEHTLARQTKNTKMRNPFTAADFTQYYIESKNKGSFEKDINELLDIIYNPEIFENKNLFLREGWQYELDSAEGELKLNGIVYNEMSGKNSPFRILGKVINKSLFPESIYRFNAGGEPKDISKLTYEHFLETYKNNYIPSNSFMFLSGKINIEKKLELINKYLSKMSRGNFANDIEIQQPFSKMQYIEEYYPANSRSNGNDRTFLALNYAVGEAREPELITALEILDSLLMADASPFKKALLNSSIGTPYTMIDIGKQLKWGLIMETDGNFNKEEFQNTAEALSKNTQISKLKEKSKNKYFEQFIEKYFLDNNHSSLVVLKPKPGLQEELTKASQPDKIKCSV